MSLTAFALATFLQITSAAPIPKWDWNAAVVPVRTSDPQLAELKRHTTLFLYFSPECSHCSDSWPQLLELAKRTRGTGLKVGAIATYATDRKQIVMFLEALGEELPVWFDSTKAVAMPYGIRTVPRAILVEPNGRVQLFGELTPERLAQIEGIARNIARAR